MNRDTNRATDKTGKSQPDAPKHSEAWADAEDRIDASPLFGGQDEAQEFAASSSQRVHSLSLSNNDPGSDLFASEDMQLLESFGLTDITEKDEFTHYDLHAQGQPTALDAPKPRQGFVQKWIAYSYHGKPDTRNIGKSQKKGWVPRTDFAGVDWAGYNRRNFLGKTVMEVTGNILCEMPEKRAKQIRANNAYKTRNLTEAAGDELRHSGDQGGVPTQYRDVTQTQYGRRRLPTVADDKGL